jgi:enoyl-CoA hydratase/carnithine racemase
MEMLLLGDMVTAERAAELGLVNKVVPPDALDATVREMADKIAAKSPLTLAIGKEAFYRQLDMDLESAYAHTAEVMTRNMMTRDAAEGIDAFLTKRQPVWRGE